MVQLKACSNGIFQKLEVLPQPYLKDKHIFTESFGNPQVWNFA